MTQNKFAQKVTHFGYEAPPTENSMQRCASQNPQLAAHQYDLMNDLMSLGIHRLWKRFAIELSGARQGQILLDLAGGTGDLAIKLSRMTGSNGLVVLADSSEPLLQVGRERSLECGFASAVQYVQTRAECLPFPNDLFHCITLSFSLQNITQKVDALAEIHRTLRPGGRLLILEFSKPTRPLFSRLYDSYSFILPLLGKWITEDDSLYQQFAGSIRRHPDPIALRNTLQKAGFCRCDYHTLSGGIVAVHRGFKL